jgi:hydrogenase 3 maturation protease
MTVEEKILKFLKDADRIVIMGIGNILRGDDAAGVVITRKIALNVPENVLVIDCGSTPENYLGKIVKFNPSHILIIDTVIVNGEPGEIKVVDESQIVDTLSFSTHKPSIHILIKYIKGILKGVKFLVLGIQPKKLTLGEEMSEEVKNAVNKISDMLMKILQSSRDGGE